MTVGNGALRVVVYVTARAVMVKYNRELFKSLQTGEFIVRYFTMRKKK